MLKRFLPKTLFMRMLLIIMLPMVLVQVVTVVIFYERHWDTVTRYMSNNLAADMAVIVDRYQEEPTEQNFQALTEYAWRYFYFQLAWEEGGVLAPSEKKTNAFAEETLPTALNRRLNLPFSHNLIHDEDRISVMVQFPQGVMTILASNKRIYSSTSLLVILWTVSMSILLLGVAVLFLRGQVRPIIRLAYAARQLGLGRSPPNFKPEGAREVRFAGNAFKAMRERISRQVVERTEMLAGVSHDLRTPLARMKLQLQYIPEGKEREGLTDDIAEMEAMINGYIDFASTATVEEMAETDLLKIIKASIKSFKKGKIKLVTPKLDLAPMPLRPQSVRRAIDNLLANAIRYAKKVEVSVEVNDNQVQIIIDDDGTGIAKKDHQRALRPFVRLDEPANTKNHAGLGLSIANEVALAHGGNLLLGVSPLGGLRVRVQLPL